MHDLETSGVLTTIPQVLWQKRWKEKAEVSR